MFLLYLFSIILVLITYLFRVRFDVFKNRLPYIPFSLKYFRETYGRHPSGQIRHVYDTLKSKGPVVGFFLGLHPMLIVTDLDLAKTVLIKDFHHFVNRGIYYNRKDDPVGASIFSAKDDRWRSLRNRITPTFSSGKIKNMLPTLIEKCGDLNRVMEEKSRNANWDQKDVFGRFTADVIGSIAFGLDCAGLKNSSEKENDFVSFGKTTFKQINELNLSALFKFEFQRLARWLKCRRYSEDLVAFYYNVCTKTMEYRQKENVRTDDFFGALMKMKDSQGEDNLTMDQLVSTSLTFFAAGFETTASTLNYALYNLAMHPEIQEMARKEVLEVLKRYSGEMSYEAISEMETVEKVLQETLRRNSVILVLLRMAGSDYQVPDTDIVIKKGERLLIPVQALQLDSENYENAEEFNIERNFQSLLTFGQGPRKCLAERFAMVEMKVALAKFMQNYRVEATEATPKKIVFDSKTLPLSTNQKFALKIAKIS